MPKRALSGPQAQIAIDRMNAAREKVIRQLPDGGDFDLFRREKDGEEIWRSRHEVRAYRVIWHDGAFVARPEPVRPYPVIPRPPTKRIRPAELTVEHPPEPAE